MNEAAEFNYDVKQRVVTGLVCYVLTSAIALGGLALGQSMLRPGNHPPDARSGALGAFAAQDGNWYVQIAETGYSWDPQAASKVALFPLYPLAASAIAAVTGMSQMLALVLVSHLCLASSFVLAAFYVKQRFPNAPGQFADYVLLAMGLFPPTLFCRMAYTEALFILLVIIFLWGMERAWSSVALALLAGLATAARFPGLALLPPLALYLWRRSLPGRYRAVRLAVLLPLACWGMTGYMAYQALKFGYPFAFIQTQQFWHERPPVLFAQKLLDLATLEPIWSVIDPGLPNAYWAYRADAGMGPFCYAFADALCFPAAVTLVTVGHFKGWINGYETLLAAGLLLITYAGRAHEMCMASNARFTAVVFPIYLVVGRLLAQLRPAFSVSCLALSGFLLGAYSAMFTVWQRVF